MSFDRNVIRRQRKLGEIPLGAGDTGERASAASRPAARVTTTVAAGAQGNNTGAAERRPSRAVALLALPEGALLAGADGVDACWRELGGQLAPHCAEHALIVEFLRRHHAVVAESSRALLRLLQTALRENAALASRTDESLLGTFQAYVDAALAEALRNAPAGAAPAARAVAASAAVSEAALPLR